MRSRRTSSIAARVTRRGAGLVLATALLVAAVPARAQIPAGIDPRLFVIGDSVLLGARDAIVARQAGWKVSVYAQEGLSTLAAPAIINASRASIGEVVVVALGNNDAGNPTTFGHRIDGVMQAIGPARRVIWANLRNSASWTPALDQQLTLATMRWPTLEIADWNARATPDPSLVYPDGLHLTPAGQAAMAELIAEHVNAYVQQRLAASTTTTTTTPRTNPVRHRHPTRRHHPSDQAPDLPIVLGAIGAAAAVVFAIGLARSRARRRRRDASGATVV